MSHSHFDLVFLDFEKSLSHASFPINAGKTLKPKQKDGVRTNGKCGETSSITEKEFYITVLESKNLIIETLIELFGLKFRKSRKKNV